LRNDFLLLVIVEVVNVLGKPHKIGEVLGEGVDNNVLINVSVVVDEDIAKGDGFLHGRYSDAAIPVCGL